MIKTKKTIKAKKSNLIKAIEMREKFIEMKWRMRNLELKLDQLFSRTKADPELWAEVCKISGSVTHADLNDWLA